MDDRLEIVREYLSGVKRWGVKYIPFREPLRSKGTKPAVEPTLEELAAKVELCEKCNLSAGRHSVVFGEGNPHALLMFIGEAPGRDEDLSGRPFVGAAGQLLTKIIEAIGLKRDEVYIANVLKCRPPQNRDPEPEEIATCREYLMRQIEAINPKIICALGKFAFQTLLGVETGIMKARGKFYNLDGIKVMATYHPSYLLRNPSEKRPVWEDMKLVRAEYERILSDRRGKS